jgi:hypothetical protein
MEISLLKRALPNSPFREAEETKASLRERVGALFGETGKAVAGRAFIVPSARQVYELEQNSGAGTKRRHSQAQSWQGLQPKDL